MAKMLVGGLGEADVRIGKTGLEQKLRAQPRIRSAGRRLSASLSSLEASTWRPRWLRAMPC